MEESSRSIRLIFHLLNSLFTLFSNTHYFGHNANLFTGIKKNNFSNGMIEAGNYGKPLIRKFRNYFIKLINRYTICNVLDPSCRIFINIILKYAISRNRLNEFNKCSTRISHCNKAFGIRRLSVIGSTKLFDTNGFNFTEFNAQPVLKKS